MKNLKKRGYNSLDDSFLKNDDVSKKHKANVSAHENQLPIDWHEVNIILDATVVEKYLNNRKSGSTISPSHREKMLVQKIPRLNQNVFSEKSNVMVKLEIPEDIRADDNLSPEGSLTLEDVPVKREDISVQEPLDNVIFHDEELIGPLCKDFYCEDNFTAEATLKNEVVELENCYEKIVIGQESKDALKNEELFIGQEFKHEEFVPSYGNVESTNDKNNEELVKKSTQSSRKRKKCLDCIDCNHQLAKEPHLYNNVVPPKLSIEKPKTRKSQAASKPSKSKSILRAKERKTNQEPHHIYSPVIRKTQKGYLSCAHCFYKGRRRKYMIKHMRRKHPYPSSIKPREHRIYDCDHCHYKGRRNNLIRHFRNKHPHLFPNDSVCCSNCDMKFNSWEEMKMHRSVCMSFFICKFCLVDIPTKKAMAKHMKAMHPEKIYVEEGGKREDAVKTLDQTPLGQRYMEVQKFYMKIKSELIKLYCPKCAVTRDKIISRWAPSCDSCNSRLQYQCQKCKETRNYYSRIWRHLKSKNSHCSIYSNLSFTDHEESSNATYQASSNDINRHDCEICDFKGTTRTKLYEHVFSAHLDDGFINARWRRPKEFCGIADDFPCRFCPMTFSSTKILRYHIATIHFDELDGKDIDQFLQEILDFRRMVITLNYKRFNDKLRNGSTETERDYYHNGIESMLQPVCIECKADGPHDCGYCAKCQASLNFVCLRCDELFSKYSIAWVHATRMCENRSFTLTVGETRKNPAKHDASTSNKKLLCCHHCSFKNTSKSILGNHIKYTHSESQEIHGLFSCHKCYQSFDNSGYFRQHKLRCRAGFHYTCQFCDKSSSNFHVIEKHITTTHANHFRCKDTLDEILQRVIENKRARTKKTNNRFDESGRIIRRTFSENVKLTAFSCPKCDETVHKNFRFAADTRTCPKCNGKLLVCCKICNKDYSTWKQVVRHFQNTECGAVEIEMYDLDHSYSLKKPSPEVTKNSVEM